MSSNFRSLLAVRRGVVSPSQWRIVRVWDGGCRPVTRPSLLPRCATGTFPEAGRVRRLAPHLITVSVPRSSVPADRLPESADRLCPFPTGATHPHPCHLPARSYPVPVKSRRPGKPALARRRQCQSHRTSERPKTARGTAHRPAHPSGGVFVDVAAQGRAALGSVEHSPHASRARRVVGHLRRYFTSPPLKANCTVCCKPITHVSASGPERGSPCRAVTRCCYGSN